MEKQTPSFISWEKLREIDLVGFLASIGYEPAKIKGLNYWYRSPLRSEKTPSFKVNARLNRWHDFGPGKGGSIIDFCLEYYQRDFQGIVQLLSGQTSLPKKEFPEIPDETPLILVTGEKPITSPALLGYLKARGIPIRIAEEHLKEINFSLNGKSLFALGFKNDLGGYEIRNQFFKGSSTPKAVSSISTGHNRLSVFEGFFDLLSYLTLRPEIKWPETDYLVLNSLSLLERSLPLILDYQAVSLYLDNDQAGLKATGYLLGKSRIIQVGSVYYKGSQDLNEFLVSRRPKLRVSRKVRLS
ncbi:toprim domain-containing protein [Ravibacter arvi]|uniref:Toprim domain-containing protein n=1 Tax=Ravibacter arvi TaxID=2051041 RepID=A0ABP8LKE3_9BACT